MSILRSFHCPNYPWGIATHTTTTVSPGGRLGVVDIDLGSRAPPLFRIGGTE